MFPLKYNGLTVALMEPPLKTWIFQQDNGFQ